MQFSAAIRSLAEGATISQVWARAMDWYRGIRLGRAVYGYTRNLQPGSIGNPDDALFLTTEDEEFVTTYFHNGFYSRTPGFRWAQEHRGMTTWKWIAADIVAGRLPPREREAALYVRNRGVQGGVTLSFPDSSHRAKGALGLMADPEVTEEDVERLTRDLGDEIFAIGHMMHYRIIQLPFAPVRRKLTERQRQALEWVADGKTALDIACLMGVSAAMVEKHLRLARQRLDVETTAQAVAKGTLLNLIHHDRV